MSKSGCRDAAVTHAFKVKHSRNKAQQFAQQSFCLLILMPRSLRNLLSAQALVLSSNHHTKPKHIPELQSFSFAKCLGQRARRHRPNKCNIHVHLPFLQRHLGILPAAAGTVFGFNCKGKTSDSSLSNMCTFGNFKVTPLAGFALWQADDGRFPDVNIILTCKQLLVLTVKPFFD